MSSGRKEPIHALHRLVLVAAALIYAALMNWSYERVESYLWEYRGYVWSPPGALYTGIGYGVTAAAALLLPLRLRRPSDIAWTAIFALVFVPITFLPFHWVRNPIDILPFVLLTLGCLAALGWLLPRRPFNVNPLPFSRGALEVFLTATAVAAGLYVLKLQGFRLTLTVDEDYSRRLAARQLVPSGTPGAYVLSLLEGTLAPLCIALGIEWRKRHMIVVGSFAMLCMFSFSGSKQSFLLPLMLVGMAYVLRRRSVSPALVLLVFLAAGIYYGANAWLEHGLIEPSANFGRRIVMSKGVSSAHYWHVFHDDPMLMRDSSLMTMLGYEKLPGKAFIVGDDLFSHVAENYDANAWAAAFANFGYVGVPLVTGLIALIFWTLDSLAEQGHFEVMCLIAGQFAYLWGEQAFESSMLSSGIAVTVILVALLGRDSRSGASPAPARATAAALAVP
ncbi:MAG: hypothetical protein HYV09_04470 [Deltaproteobacteria bacterium]|nr:hypothetical protein [Deltaproteobacteria bacterium]